MKQTITYHPLEAFGNHLCRGAFSGMEAIEREICGSKADSDPLYDMHYNNATGLIRRLNPPPVKEYQTPLFYRTGGMK